MEAEHFKRSYETGEAPWDIGKPDLNLIRTVTTAPIEACKALEIGCGTGDNAIWLAQQKFDVVAVDFSELAIGNARRKADRAGVTCEFRVLDILQDEVEGAPFRFVFDRGFLHTISSDESRRSLAEKMSRHLEDGGQWLTLVGSADEQRQGPGPPQRSARDIVNAVEPYFEILSLVSGQFGSNRPEPPRAWICLMRKRPAR